VPPDPIARELSVTYGTVTVGGAASPFQLHGKIRIQKAWDRASVEFDALVTGSTEAEFAAQCAALEAAFSDPDKGLAVVQGSATLLSFSGAPKDACVPSVRKEASDADTGRSRLYVCRVDVDPAADMVSPSGLREVGIDVAYSPVRRRTVTVAGTWTAVGTSGARSRYEAAIAGYANAILAALGGTYELAEEPVTREDRTGHLIEFRRVYRERIFQEAGSGLDDPDLFGQACVLRRSQEAPGDSERGVGAGTGGSSGTQGTVQVRRLARYECRYSASIAQGKDMRQKWDSIRDWLANLVQSTFEASGLALVEESPGFDEDDRRIEATLVFLGGDKGTDTVERSLSVTDEDDDDQVLVPAWTGDRFSRYSYDGPTEFVRTVAETARVLKDLSLPDARARIRALFPSGTQDVRGADGGGAWTRGRFTLRVRPVTIGTDEHHIEATDVELTWRRRLYKPVTSTTSANPS
jgi:hypothetical protein